MQDSYNITPALAKGGLAYRAAVNAALQALASNNLGEEAAATAYEGMGQFFNEGTTWTYKIYTGAEGHEWVTILAIDLATGTVTFSEEGIAYATASEALAGALANKVLSPATFNAELVKNLKPVVNASVNKLDLLTKSGGALPDSDNVITVAIPDGNGYTFRSRSAAYLSGTSQFILADATAYWGAVSGTDKIKLHKYAIWDGAGIVWALSRFAGFHKVPTTTTVGDDDYFLIEAGSTYVRDASHHCVCVGHDWANYNTANTPDWTLYDDTTSVELSPQVVWNPKSDYAGQEYLATDISSGADLADQAVISKVVKQSGRYAISGVFAWYTPSGLSICRIRTGSPTYLSATLLAQSPDAGSSVAYPSTLPIQAVAYLNTGDSIHLGGGVSGSSGNRLIYGISGSNLNTTLQFRRID
jgi:hypothetical protein